MENILEIFEKSAQAHLDSEEMGVLMKQLYNESLAYNIITLAALESFMEDKKGKGLIFAARGMLAAGLLTGIKFGREYERVRGLADLLTAEDDREGTTKKESSSGWEGHHSGEDSGLPSS